MKGLEILAPAGSMQALTAAVRAGADAVYLGSHRFSARTSAHNFDDAELEEAVRYCHENGAAVHLAVNTLVRCDEIRDAMRLIEYACSLGVDALIMQDMGLISLTRRCCPEMPVHASTQLSVHTADGVLLLAEMGLKRVVLSRELSFEEIKEITSKSPVEIEVFVHGALCMCVSGQCYFSAMLGSRSGNRGACAQPCRLPFSVNGGTGHDLSLKDLSVIEHLRELQEIGVASAKIEGRMKRPEYVAASVAACRQSLDNGNADPKLTEKLKAVFSRSGFTSGYYDGKTGPEMFGIRTGEDAAAGAKVFPELHELYKRERQHVPVSFDLKVRKGESVSLTVSDSDGNSASAEAGMPEQALRVALDSERAAGSLKKTGGTPYSAAAVQCEIEDGLTVPGAVLNSLRSEALTKLSDKRRKLRPTGYKACEMTETSRRSFGKPGIRARFPDCDVPDGFLDCELIYVPLFVPDKKLDALLERGFAAAVEIPRGMFGAEEKIRRRLERMQQLGIDEVLAGNIGAVQTALQLGMIVHGDFGLNIFNTCSAEAFREIGLEDAELSFELTLKQISEIGGELPRGIISYGRLPLMLTRNCPAQNDGRGCKHCRTAPVITDRKGVSFPMQCFGSCTEILNSVPLSLADRQKEIENVDFTVLRFTTETPEQRAKVLSEYISGSKPEGTYTRGLYYRGVQ